ncbi:hypothetical protein [Hamadaea sp.]|uniref:hypothetical protein n=1 Tax=Hamadaea sp. TaxID=2024425 RepID=UPI0025B87B9B|nr:hypothetical protein [Hamadaea sp.]
MSPRRNLPRKSAKAGHRDLNESAARGGVELEYGADGTDGDWNVRHVTAGAATKAYRCPGCDHEIPPGVAHVVAWPADGRGDSSDRRHWHTACWRARHRRQPTRKFM